MKRLAGMLLLLVMASAHPALFEPVQKSTCTCTTQCGECGGRLRGCINGFPICECFRC